MTSFVLPPAGITISRAAAWPAFLPSPPAGLGRARPSLPPPRAADASVSRTQPVATAGAGAGRSPASSDMPLSAAASGTMQTATAGRWV